MLRQDGVQELFGQSSLMAVHVDKDSWTVCTKILMADKELTEKTSTDSEEGGSRQKEEKVGQSKLECSQLQKPQIQLIQCIQGCNGISSKQEEKSIHVIVEDLMKTAFGELFLQSDAGNQHNPWCS